MSLGAAPKACVPKHKHDHEALERARQAGFPAINPVLPDLLIWMQDMNWPVAAGVADLLSGAGPGIAPQIRAVFASDDAVWKFWILTALCPRLPPEILAELEAELGRLADHPTPADIREEVPEAARALLSAARTSSPDPPD